MPGTPTLPALKGFGLRGLNERPTIREYSVDPSSTLTIRIGDPVKQVAGGFIQRAGPADSALLGFALEPSDPSSYVAREIAVPPVFTDAAGRTKIRVAVADGNNVFMGAVNLTTSLGIVTKRCDLVAAIASPATPTATPGGTTGSTNLYYFIVAVDVLGRKAANGASGTTSTANATVSSTNFVDLSWTAATGADYYEIWKATSNSAAAASLIGTTTGTTFRDIGTAGTGAGLINTVNNTGVYIASGTSSTNVIQILGIVPMVNMPIGTTNGLVEFSIPPTASQYLGASGS